MRSFRQHLVLNGLVLDHFLIKDFVHMIIFLNAEPQQGFSWMDGR